jgi:hypothetical protein
MFSGQQHLEGFIFGVEVRLKAVLFRIGREIGLFLQEGSQGRAPARNNSTLQRFFHIREAVLLPL